MAEDSNITDQRTAYALLRIVVGLNLMMHGISRMVAGPGEFAAKLVMQFSHAPLPAWSVWLFGLTLPTIEGLLRIADPDRPANPCRAHRRNRPHRCADLRIVAPAGLGHHSRHN